jgi:choline/glycine/proline betaine transport protein
MLFLHKFKTLLRDWRNGVSPPVFFAAAAFNTALIIFAGLWTDTAGRVFNAVLIFITRTFGWYYILTTAGILVFVLWLLCSRYGRIRFGQPDEKPQYSRSAWLAMLFAAGMGMGLVFWGVAEPLFHYQIPPTSTPRTEEAIREALQFSFFHWGLHPWAVYVVFGLGIALLHYRHDLPLAPRSLLQPLFGHHIHGWLGHATDAFCTVGTLLGVATSLGLGAMQINAGLSRLTEIEYVTHIQILIIGLITVVATASTVSGVSRGIKYLSMFNVTLMLFLLSFVFLTGPTLYQMKVLFLGASDYVLNLAETSFWIDSRPNAEWQSNWTLFYWGWWISWSPFVGIFIARISRGRTVREFIFFVLLIPTLMNILWFSVFGGTALHIEESNGGLAQPVTDNVAMSLHLLLEHLPWTELMQWIGLGLVVIFFITSSDSGSFVDDMVTSGGNPNPPVANRIFWGVSEGAAAAVLLLAGGLKALQAASISAGLPQSLLLIFACVGLVKTLRKETLP